jgi:hypothetical protein
MTENTVMQEKMVKLSENRIRNSRNPLGGTIA